jgi:tripartite-type tricarboxylate transporter receptor subunit TctC
MCARYRPKTAVINTIAERHMKLKTIVIVVACLAQLLLMGAVAFPDRPIKLIVTSPAGGPPDIMARLVSDGLSAALGQPVIVENRAGGAGGTIGAKSVLAAAPDGHTLLLGSTSSLLIAPLISQEQSRWGRIVETTHISID